MNLWSDLTLYIVWYICIRPATLLKKRLWHRCFPVNCANFLRTPFLTDYVRSLLLIFKALCNTRILRTLPYLELCHVQILAYLGHEAYSESCLCKRIQAYLGICDNYSSNNCNNINFLFFSLQPYTLSTKFKKTCFLTTVTSI